MKFLFFAILITLCIFQLTIIEAARSKRAVSRETCPEEHKTKEQCEAYAKQKVAEKNSCARYGVSDGEIVWHSCGLRVCVDNLGKSFRAKEKDLTKSYPDCCPKCPKKVAN